MRYNVYLLKNNDINNMILIKKRVRIYNRFIIDDYRVTSNTILTNQFIEQTANLSGVVTIV